MASKKRSTKPQVAQVEKDSAAITKSIQEQSAKQTTLLGSMLESQQKSAAATTEALQAQVTQLGSLFGEAVSSMNAASAEAATRAAESEKRSLALQSATRQATSGASRSLGQGVPRARVVDSSAVEKPLLGQGPAGSSRATSFVASNPITRRVFGT